MTKDEVIDAIFDFCKTHEHMDVALNDFCAILQNPGRQLKNPFRACHMKIGEHTLTSMRYYYKRLHELYAPESLMKKENLSYVYSITGEWGVCDDCGELALCTADFRDASCRCIYCRAKNWVDRCCDKSENLDSEIMRHYLQTGEVNPLLSFVRIPDMTKEIFRSPMRVFKNFTPCLQPTLPDDTPKVPIRLKPMTEAEKAYLGKQFRDLGFGDKISAL